METNMKVINPIVEEIESTLRNSRLENRTEILTYMVENPDCEPDPVKEMFSISTATFYRLRALVCEAEPLIKLMEKAKRIEEKFGESPFEDRTFVFYELLRHKNVYATTLAKKYSMTAATIKKYRQRIRNMGYLTDSWDRSKLYGIRPSTIKELIIAAALGQKINQEVTA